MGMIILRVGVVLDSVVWPRVVAPLGLPCRCCSHDCIHRSALCRLTLLLVSPVALLPPFAPLSASQSAISLPGTPVCDRTCTMSTRPGCRVCTLLHSLRKCPISSAFRCCRRGIHLPVVIFLPYSDSVYIIVLSFVSSRCMVRLSAYARAVSSPVFWRCAFFPKRLLRDAELCVVRGPFLWRTSALSASRTT